MTRNSLALRLAGFLAAAILAAPNAATASTYSTYSGDDTRSAKAGGVFTNCQYFRLNADWLFSTEGDALAASATALSLDSITVHWPSSTHANATIGGTGETQPDAYLVVTSPLDVIVGISAVNDAKWTANGTSMFAFSGLVLAANVQYRYYFVTSVDGLQVGATLASSVNARVEAVYHGTREANTSDSIVRCGASDTYSIHSDFAVSAADEASSYTATVSSDKVWSAIEWDGGKTWNDATSSAVVTLAIDEGATVTAPANLNVAALLVSGDGTLTFAEGENAVSSYAVVSAKVSVPSGATLKTSGDVLLSSTANEIAPGGTLEVVSGVTRADTYTDENWSGGFKGTLTIDSGAKFVNLHSSDALAFNPDAATPVNVNVAGTLDMGTTRWTLSNNVFVNMQGGTVTGTGDGSNGALDFIGTSALSASADSTISASVRIRAQSIDVAVADGATLTLSGTIYNEPSNQNAASAGIAKKGAGTLVVSGAAVTLPAGVGIDAGVIRLGGGAAGLSVSVPNGGGTLEAVSGATLTGTATFAGHIPSDANKTLLGSASWTGMVVIDGLTQDNTDLTGLGGRVTLKNYSGYLDKTKSTSSLALTVTGTFTQTNGWSNDGDKVSLASLSGDATMGDEYNLSNGANPAQLFSIADISSFTGTFDFDHCRVTTTGDFTLDKAQKVATLTVGGTLAVSGGSLTGNLVANNVAVTAESDVAVGERLVGVSGTTTVSGAVTLNGYAVAYEIKDGGIYRAEPTVTITVPAVANATATVTVGGETVAANEDGTYSVVAGSTVTVTYAANDGYALSGTTTYTIENAADGATIDASETTAALVVATFNRVSYTTLEAALNAWKTADAATANGGVSLVADYELASALTIAANENNSDVPLQLLGGSKTLTGDVTVASGVTFVPNNLTIAGNVTVNGTLHSVGAGNVSITGGLTFGSGATISATALSASTAVFTVSGALSVQGDIVVALYSDILEGGTYALASGASATMADGAQVSVTLNGAANDIWVLSVDDTTLVLKGAAAMVDGDRYETFDEAADAAGSEKVIELLNSASYEFSAGETLKIKAGEFNFTYTVAEGYGVSASKADENGVVTYSVYKYAAKLSRLYAGETQVDYYTTLAGAVAAVAGVNPPVNMTLELLGDATLDETLALAAPSGYGLTLDLGGYTLTGPADGYAISNSGRLTISNGSISAEGIVENTASGASATIQSGTYSASGDSAFSAVEGSTITVKAGVVFTTDIDASYCETGYATRAVTDAAGVTTYVVSEDKGWIYEDKDYPGYTGTWTTEVVYDDDGRVAIEDSNTYTPAKASAGELVTVSLTMSFDAERDDEDALEDGAQAGIRLGPDSTFQIYTLVDADGTETAKWLDVAADGVTPATETDYTFKFTLDYNAKTYTVAVVDGETERALASGETTAFPLADKTKTSVSRLDFDGSGTVTSITGSYEDAEVPTEKFNDGDDVEVEDGKITLDDKQAKWLNSYGDYAAVKEAIAALDAKTFNDAYLLNLDVTADEFSYEFDVTDIEVGDTTVKVTATLTRTGARTADGAALPINGTLKLLGSAELAPDTFTEQGTAEVDDGKMSSGSATLTFPIPAENPPTFFTATIE